MSNRTKRILCLSIMTLMLTVGFLPFVPTVSATNDPPVGFGTYHVLAMNDWTVKDARSYVPTGGPTYTIIMDAGNVIVANGGTLTLDHVNIQFTLGGDGQHGIVVQAGGTLIMKNKATITPTAPSFPRTFFCGFLAGSTISIDNSAISAPGGRVLGSPYPWNTGIYIGTSNITVNLLQASNNGNGLDVPLVYNDADGVVFKNSSFYNIKNDAIVANRSTTIYDSIILYSGPAGWEGAGVYVAPESSLKMGTVDIAGEAEGVWSYGDVTMDHCRLHNNTYQGIYGEAGSTFTIKNTEIPDNYDGIYLVNGASATLTGNDRIYYNGRYGLAMENLAYANVTDARISFNPESNIYTSDSILDMTRVTVEDAGSNSPSLELGILSQATIKDSNLITKGWGTFVHVYVWGGSTLNMTRTTLDGASTAMNLLTERSTYVELEKDTFLGGWGEILAGTGATVISRNTIYKDFSIFGFNAGLETFISSTKDSGGTSKASTTLAEVSEGGSIEIRNGDFALSANPNAIAYSGQDSSVYLTDSKFVTTASNPTLGTDTGGYIRAINCGGIDPMLTQVQTGGLIDIGWHVDVKTQWQNAVPAPWALVEFNDRFGVTTEMTVTGDDGTAKTDVIAVTILDSGMVKHNKYLVNASLNGMDGSTGADITKNLIGPGAIVVTLTDDSAPDLNVTFPTDKWATNETKFTMNGTAGDLGSMLDGVYVQLDSTTTWTQATDTDNWTYDLNLTEGPHAIHVQARDIAGLVTNMTVNVVIDLTAPTITIDQPTTLYVTTHAFYLNGTTNDANATMTVNGTGVTNTAGKFSQQLNLPDGPFDIKVTAKDKVGNMASKIVSVIIDTVPPTLSADTADQAWLNTKQFTLTGKSDGNNVTVNGVSAVIDKTNKTWKIPLTLNEGANSLQIQALDLAGNKNKLTLNLNVDTIPPTLNVTFPSGTGIYYTNKAAMNVTGKVTGANTLTVNSASTSFSTDGNFTSPITLVSGSNLITVVAKDLAGNQVKWNMTVVLDTVAPKVTITSPKDGLVTNVAGQTIVGTVDDTTASIKQGTTSVTNSNGAFTTPFSLSAGANTITITATDLAGNVGKATITVTLKTDVALTITTPKNGKATTSAETTTIKGTAEAGATVTINDMNVPVDSSGAFSGKVTLKEGKNTFTIVAKDAAGNTKTQTVTVTYNDAKQYDMTALLGLAIVLMIVGLIIGLVVGMVMGRRKAKPPMEETTYPKAPTKPAPVEEEKGFTPEEEEEVPEEKPAPKAPLKDKQGDIEAPTSVTEPKPAPKPEPKPAPKIEPKPAPPKETPKTTTPAKDKDGSLEDLLRGLEKK